MSTSTPPPSESALPGRRAFLIWAGTAGLITSICSGAFLLGVGAGPRDGETASPRTLAPFVARTRGWEDAMARAQVAMDRGAFPEAERWCDEALRTAEATFGSDSRQAKTLWLSGQVYRAQQKWDLAEKRFKEAIGSAEAVVGPSNPELLPPLEALGDYYFLVRHRYDLALPIMERLLRLLQAADSPDNRAIARQTNSLAVVYEKLDRYDEAESMYHEALKLGEKNGDDISPILLVVADFYQTWGKLDCAEAMAIRAVELREKPLGTAAEKKIELAAALYKLAEIYRLWEKPDTAQPIYNRCLALIEKSGASTSSVIVPPLAGRAAALRDQGKLIEAEADYRRALAVAQQTMDAALPEVTTLVDVYAGLLVQLHRNKEADTVHAVHQWRTYLQGASRELKANHLAEAERLCSAAIELCPTFISPDINPSDAPLLMGEIYRAQGRVDLAEQSYQQALATCEISSGPEAPAVLVPLEALANFYYFTHGRQRQVARLDLRILDIAETAYAAEPGEVARRACNLADVYHRMRCNEKAVTYYRKAVALSETMAGDSGERVPYLQALGDFYRHTGCFADAADAHRRALELRESAVEENPSPDIQRELVASLDALSEDYLAAKQAEKAEPLCRRAASLLASIGGVDTADLVPRLTRLGMALRALGKWGEAESFLKQAQRIAEKNPGLPGQSTLDESYAALLLDLRRPEEAKALLARVGKNPAARFHHGPSDQRAESENHSHCSGKEHHERRGHRGHGDWEKESFGWDEFPVGYSSPST